MLCRVIGKLKRKFTLKKVWNREPGEREPLPIHR